MFLLVLRFVYLCVLLLIIDILETKLYCETIIAKKFRFLVSGPPNLGLRRDLAAKSRYLFRIHSIETNQKKKKVNTTRKNRNRVHIYLFN